MVSIVVVFNTIAFFWKKRWLEKFDGSSVQILQLKNDLQAIDNKLKDYDESVKAYVIDTGLKKSEDVQSTDRIVERDLQYLEDVNNNFGINDIFGTNVYSNLTTMVDYNIRKLEDTSQEFKETMREL
jgi:hypothetical protein